MLGQRPALTKGTDPSEVFEDFSNPLILTVPVLTAQHHRRRRRMHGVSRISWNNLALTPWHQQFEIYGYDLAGVDDEVTRGFRKACDHWRSLRGKSSSEIRGEVLRDEIDILVDLSGHFTPHALDVFHQRAAPIQVAYPIYPCTTGSKSFDFMLSDIWTTPDQEAERQYSERSVYRLPSGYLVFNPPVATELTPLPALTNGYVTFGVFQKPPKYSSEFWDATASILLRCQGSRLMVQCAIRDFEAPDCWARKTIIRQLKRRGVDAERIDFVGYQTVATHLDVVARADIALARYLAIQRPDHDLFVFMDGSTSGIPSR